MPSDSSRDTAPYKWLFFLLFCYYTQLKVMSRKLFRVEPKSGKLSPGESCTITVTYEHLTIGTDRLPVVFKISRGREILVRFRAFVSAFLQSLDVLMCSDGDRHEHGGGSEAHPKTEVNPLPP